MADCGSAWGGGGSRGRGLSVMVLDDEARECEDGGCGAAFWGAGGGKVAGGALSSSSGFAMRRPPRDCDRLRSPFMVEGAGG